MLNFGHASFSGLFITEVICTQENWWSSKTRASYLQYLRFNSWSGMLHILSLKGLNTLPYLAYENFEII
jgi:hypothetical protein